MHKSLYHCNIELELYTPNTIDCFPYLAMIMDAEIQ